MFLSCPRCQTTLLPAYLGRAKVFRCKRCLGVSIATASLHRRSGLDFVSGLYGVASSRAAKVELRCP
ncbi:MAG: zf-TFIIB domain-containing protein, partial [Bdellovibrionales bacterium]|nr:zf-TFIIB domain-containing protein [Bdellovibrionales bacterium]